MGKRRLGDICGTFERKMLLGWATKTKRNLAGTDLVVTDISIVDLT